MGFIEAFKGALGGSFADQWKDFYTVPTNVSDTAGIFPVIQHRVDAGRGSNVLGSENIITNGSKIVVPEGFALVTFQNGALTGFVATPGGYIYSTDSVHSASFFSGGGLIESVVKNSWERFKFGGIPGDQQLAFYVNLKEIPNNRFGTQSEIYWDDAYMRAQVGAITRGTYTLRIIDPILFVKGFVPVRYLSQNAPAFDFADLNNDAAEQLFNEVVQSLSAALSNYTNDPAQGNRITRIQGDSVGFAKSLSSAVEQNYQWSSARGLAIVTAALLAIEYDAASKALLADVQKADALSGGRGDSFFQQATARGIEAAGNSDAGAVALAMMGAGIGAVSATGGAMAQANAGAAAAQPAGWPPPMPGGAAPAAAPVAGAAPAPAAGAAVPGAVPPPLYDPQTGLPLQPPAPAAAPVAAPVPAPAPAAAPAADPYEELTKLKGLLDAGIITQSDFDAKKAQLLGL